MFDQNYSHIINKTEQILKSLSIRNLPLKKEGWIPKKSEAILIKSF